MTAQHAACAPTPHTGKTANKQIANKGLANAYSKDTRRQPYLWAAGDDSVAHGQQAEEHLNACRVGLPLPCAIHEPCVVEVEKVLTVLGTLPWTGLLQILSLPAAEGMVGRGRQGQLRGVFSCLPAGSASSVQTALALSH